MTPNYREKGPQNYYSGSEEEQVYLPRRRDQSGTLRIVNRQAIINKDGPIISFYIYFLLFFVAFFALLPHFDDSIRAFFPRTTIEAQNFTKGEIPNPNNTTTPLQNTKNKQFTNLPKPTTQPPFTCPLNSDTTIQKCPTNPLSQYTTIPTQDDVSSLTQTEICPDYFRWIHEDLKPWKQEGIRKEALEAGIKHASFRLLVSQGRVYVETYGKSYGTRDVFTIWGIIQLLRLYPGKVPDLDLIFNCNDTTTIKKAQYRGNAQQGGLNLAPLIPPMFHYCGDDDSFDISFPDWSFWGWCETNIKPWEVQLKDIKEGNERVKWMDRVPYAYWKGNFHMGYGRKALSGCNSSHWNTQLFENRWVHQVRNGFRDSNLANQCTHRYKIYVEGLTWSVSEKYIQACDSMLLFVRSRYYEFFTRSLMPLKHYWPINPYKLCRSIKFAVDWGNNNTDKAQEIAKEGSRFVMEELKMKNVYDYMLHLLNEYARLLKYKPTIPPGAVEVCLESMICNSTNRPESRDCTSTCREQKWKIDSMVRGPSQTGPCTMPQPYEPDQLQNFLNLKNDIAEKVDKWVATGDIGNVDFS